MRDDLRDLYRTRFSDTAEEKKNGIWIEICKYFGRFLDIRNLKMGGVAVDVAAGYCDFINNIVLPASVKKVAFDANPDAKRWASKNVEVIVDDISNIKEHFKDQSVSLVFMSNFLEHIGKDTIVQLFSDIRNMLKDDGELWILTPNIKYVGGKYWDFFDHITPITDDSLIELAESMGYKTKVVIHKFLPFTTKSRFPQWRWIVALYLKLMPVSGRFFGEQSFIILKK